MTEGEMVGPIKMNGAGVEVEEFGEQEVKRTQC